MIDLARFCDTEGDRPALAQPFVIDGWQYATNGRIMVRVPTTEPDTTDRKIPRAAGIFADRPADVAYTACPPPELACECDGVKQRPCNECGGYGEVTCNYEHVHECPDCDGTGMTDTCSHCWDGIDFAGGYFASRLLRLAFLLPGVRFAVAYDKGWFVFDGGEGVMIAMERDNEGHT